MALLFKHLLTYHSTSYVSIMVLGLGKPKHLKVIIDHSSHAYCQSQGIES